MFVVYVATWLLIFTMDCAVCTDSTVTIGASVFEYSSSHTANGYEDTTSSPSESLSEASPLEPSNTISKQVTATLQLGPLSPTEVPQQSSMPALIEPSSKSPTTPINESATHVTDSSTSVGSTQITAELSPTLLTSTSTANDSSIHLVEPTSTSVESPSASDREVAMPPSLHDMSSVPSLWSQSATLLMPSEYVDIPSTDLTSSVSSYYTYIFSTSTQTENSTIILSSAGDFALSEIMESLASSNATNTPFEPIPDLPHSLYSDAATTEDTTQTVSFHSVASTVKDTTQTVSPDSVVATVEDITQTVPSDSVASTVEDTIQTVSSDSVASTVEDTKQTVPSDSVASTVEDTTQTVSSDSVASTVEETTQTVSLDSVAATVEYTMQTVNSLESSALSGYEPVTNSFHESISGYNSVTFETASEPEIIFTNTLHTTDSITVDDTASLITTTVPSAETTASHQAAEITPTTKVTSSSIDIITSTPGTTESSTPVQDLPGKSSKGLSTGSKVAIGIIVPLAVIGLIILGVFFYRRYTWNRGSFKNFLQPGVHYRAYTNETFTDDDDATIGGSWRKMSD